MSDPKIKRVLVSVTDKTGAVSYTHLDVYKRQQQRQAGSRQAPRPQAAPHPAAQQRAPQPQRQAAPQAYTQQQGRPGQHLSLIHI